MTVAMSRQTENGVHCNGSNGKDHAIAPIDYESLAKELLCILCQRICRDPVATVCLHRYCRSCLEATLRINRNCPLCSKALPESDNEAFWTDSFTQQIVRVMGLDTDKVYDVDVLFGQPTWHSGRLRRRANALGGGRILHVSASAANLQTHHALSNGHRSESSASLNGFGDDQASTSFDSTTAAKKRSSGGKYEGDSIVLRKKRRAPFTRDISLPVRERRMVKQDHYTNFMDPFNTHTYKVEREKIDERDEDRCEELFPKGLVEAMSEEDNDEFCTQQSYAVSTTFSTKRAPEASRVMRNCEMMDEITRRHPQVYRAAPWNQGREFKNIVNEEADMIRMDKKFTADLNRLRKKRSSESSDSEVETKQEVAENQQTPAHKGVKLMIKRSSLTPPDGKSMRPLMVRAEILNTEQAESASPRPSSRGDAAATSSSAAAASLSSPRAKSQAEKEWKDEEMNLRYELQKISERHLSMDIRPYEEGDSRPNSSQNDVDSKQPKEEVEEDNQSESPCPPLLAPVLQSAVEEKKTTSRMRTAASTGAMATYKHPKPMQTTVRDSPLVLLMLCPNMRADKSSRLPNHIRRTLATKFLNVQSDCTVCHLREFLLRGYFSELVKVFGREKIVVNFSQIVWESKSTQVQVIKINPRSALLQRISSDVDLEGAKSKDKSSNSRSDKGNNDNAPSSQKAASILRHRSSSSRASTNSSPKKSPMKKDASIDIASKPSNSSKEKDQKAQQQTDSNEVGNMLGTAKTLKSAAGTVYALQYPPQFLDDDFVVSNAYRPNADSAYTIVYTLSIKGLSDSRIVEDSSDDE